MFFLEENFTTVNNYGAMDPVDLITSLQEDLAVYSQIVIACMTEEVMFSLNEDTASEEKDKKPEAKQEGFWAKVKNKVIAGLRKLKEIFMKIGAWVMNALRLIVTPAVLLMGGLNTVALVKEFSSKYPAAYSDFEKYMKSPNSELAEKIESEVTELNNKVEEKPKGGIGKVASSTVLKVYDECFKNLTKCVDTAIRISNNTQPDNDSRKIFNLMVVTTPHKINAVIFLVKASTTMIRSELAKQSKGSK